jgi:hypothetical protein
VRAIHPFASIAFTISFADCGDIIVRSASWAFDRVPSTRNTDSAV